MSKLMYSELGGFAHFHEANAPAGWVDGDPIWKKMMDAKNLPTKNVEEVVTIQPVAPQDTKRRPGRPPKIVE